jgi:hypothetical protein
MDSTRKVVEGTLKEIVIGRLMDARSTSLSIQHNHAVRQVL